LVTKLAVIGQCQDHILETITLEGIKEMKAIMVMFDTLNRRALPPYGCEWIHAKRAGERRQSLVQTVDLPATLLEYFNVERPKDMQGIPLRETIESDKKIREAALFGAF